ncbi:hypothetical protein I4U23_016396 [Adineta vaga]|nr:hypothetical protein I4U23_016396 [Adineta vaga]
MVESNISKDFSRIFRQLAETQTNAIQSMFTNLIIVHDDKVQAEHFKQLNMVESNYYKKLYVFMDAEECYDYIIQAVSEDQQNQFIVFVGGSLVCDLVSSIHPCGQVKKIIIINQPPFNEKEQDILSNYSKAITVADMSKESTTNNNHLAIETPFNDSVQFTCVDEKELEENLCIEPTDRSFKSFDKDFVFRHMLLMCLLQAPSSESNNNDLIELFEKENIALARDIQNFKETYSPDQAIFFYTRDVYIYRVLNEALRTKNLRHLLPFRFVLQNIYEQLREQMEKDSSNQVLTLYRCQRSSEYEIVDLLVAYHQHSPVVINSFFSTSKEKTTALLFLDSTRLEDMNHVQIIFTITACKQNVSPYFPFADISKFSNHADEKEILFVPGQMFYIDKVDIHFEEKTKVYSIQMSLQDSAQERFQPLYQTFQNMLEKDMNDSLLYLARFLLTTERFDEAKDLYKQLLEKTDDKNKRYNCYEGLFSIAKNKNNNEEAEMMYHKMNETRFGSEQLTTTDNVLLVTESDCNDFNTNINILSNTYAQMSEDRSLDELLAYASSDDYRNSLEQTAHLTYNMVEMVLIYLLREYQTSIGS